MNAWHALTERLGRVGLVAALLLLAALGWQLLINRPLQQQLEGLRVRPAATATPAAVARPASPASELVRFQATLPAAPDTAAQLRRLLAAAQAQGLVLQSGEYRLETRPADRFSRYRIALPVQGSYTQIRRFSETALAELPALALDEIEFRRDDASSPTLEARLRFTLFLRGGE